MIDNNYQEEVNENDIKEKRANDIRKKGLLIASIMVIFLIICTFICGFTFRQTNQLFTRKGVYRIVGALQVTLIVGVFIIISMSYCSFSCCQKNNFLLFFLLGFNGLCMVFTLAVSIFFFVAGTMGNLDKYVGCQTKFKGLFNAWQAMDNLVALADQSTCTSNCKCYVSPYTETMFLNDPITSPIYKYFYNTIVTEDKDYLKNSNLHPVSFDKCAQDTFDSKKEIILSNFNKKIELISTSKFIKFWKYIETKYDCVGWCSTSAIIDYDLIDLTEYSNLTNLHRFNVTDTEKELLTYMPHQLPFSKYIFSDINRGIPKRRGCMGHILRYIPRLLLTFGSFGLFIGLLQIVILLFIVCIIKNIPMKSEQKPLSENKVDENEVKESPNPQEDN